MHQNDLLTIMQVGTFVFLSSFIASLSPLKVFLFWATALPLHASRENTSPLLHRYKQREMTFIKTIYLNNYQQKKYDYPKILQILSHPLIYIASVLLMPIISLPTLIVGWVACYLLSTILKTLWRAYASKFTTDEQSKPLLLSQEALHYGHMWKSPPPLGITLIMLAVLTSLCYWIYPLIIQNLQPIATCLLAYIALRKSKQLFQTYSITKNKNPLSSHQLTAPKILEWDSPYSLISPAQRKIAKADAEFLEDLKSGLSYLKRSFAEPKNLTRKELHDLNNITFDIHTDAFFFEIGGTSFPIDIGDVSDFLERSTTIKTWPKFLANKMNWGNNADHSIFSLDQINRALSDETTLSANRQAMQRAIYDLSKTSTLQEIEKKLRDIPNLTKNESQIEKLTEQKKAIEKFQSSGKYNNFVIDDFKSYTIAFRIKEYLSISTMDFTASLGDKITDYCGKEPTPIPDKFKPLLTAASNK
jgi:hypothetical protein